LTRVITNGFVTEFLLSNWLGTERTDDRFILDNKETPFNKDHNSLGKTAFEAPEGAD